MVPTPDKKATRSRARESGPSKRDEIDVAVDRVFRGVPSDALIAAIAAAAKDALRARLARGVRT